MVSVKRSLIRSHSNINLNSYQSQLIGDNTTDLSRCRRSVVHAGLSLVQAPWKEPMESCQGNEFLSLNNNSLTVSLKAWAAMVDGHLEHLNTT